MTISFNGEDLENPSTVSITISALICFFIYVPLILYHGYKFYLKHNHLILRKRYAIITIYEIYLMTAKVIWAPIEHVSSYYLKPNNILHQLILFGNIILTYFVLYCWVWKHFLIHYDVILTATIINNQWRVYIDPEYEINSMKNTIKWYLTNKKTFGNFYWTRKRIFIIASICAIITFITLLFAAISDKHC